MMQFLHPDIERYASSHSSPESDVLQKLSRETHAKILRARMLSGHMQGKLLEMISCMIRPERILEIGTYTGYSAICLSKGLREDGRIVTIDHNEELEEFTRRFFRMAGIEEKIDYRIGEALDILPALDGVFNLVFIDADKENYRNYYDIVLEKMPVGGIILADNVLWSGKVLSEKAAAGDPEAIALIAFNEYVQQDPGVENIMLPFRDGLSLIRKC